ncbi:MAG: hypothetical protein PHH00_04360 [Candidatus Nanoarchaeia archaeon]|nr:hypothetical protein [Candidatus Nanoarchaeia archaeon]
MAIKSGKAAKKGFFEVSAPFTSAKILLYASSPEELDGKVVSLDLTRSLRGKSFLMSIRVGAEGEKLVGEPVALELAESFIRRMIRTGTDYVEDSFEAECKDGKARMKVFMITRNKVSRAVRKDLRNTGREFLQSYARMRNVKEIFNDLMMNKVQRELSFKLKKIYPLALCEVKSFRLMSAEALKNEKFVQEAAMAKAASISAGIQAAEAEKIEKAEKAEKKAKRKEAKDTKNKVLEPSVSKPSGEKKE